MKKTSSSVPTCKSVTAVLNTTPTSTMTAATLTALVYCALLAMQFGLQPTLVKSFTPAEISKKSIVIATEIAKIVITVVTILATETAEERSKISGRWSLVDSLEQAAVPAVLYALQNVLTQFGYQLLDSMTFNLLNQTKIISSAVCLYLFMDAKQSLRQCIALIVLLLAALLLSLPKDLMSTAVAAAAAILPSVTAHLKAAEISAALRAALTVPQTVISSLAAAAVNSNIDGALYRQGVLCVLSASVLSGVCAMLTQKTLQQSKRHPLFYSAEMAVYGILALLVSSMGLSFSGRLEKGALQWDLQGGLAELGWGVKFDEINVWSRSPAWVLIPVVVNVSSFE